MHNTTNNNNQNTSGLSHTFTTYRDMCISVAYLRRMDSGRHYSKRHWLQLHLHMYNTMPAFFCVCPRARSNHIWTWFWISHMQNLKIFVSALCFLLWLCVCVFDVLWISRPENSLDFLHWSFYSMSMWIWILHVIKSTTTHTVYTIIVCFGCLLCSFQ